MSGTELAGENRAANLAWTRKEGLAPPIAAIAAAPAGMAVILFDRRWCEHALYRIEKTPRLARKQGAYSVVTATGLVLKCGHDLRLVIATLDTRLKLVSE
jgi:Protein of unknown function (DUF2794)